MIKYYQEGMENCIMDIGVKIRDIRQNEYKENSRDFANRCGISKSCLLQIERGQIIKPTKKVLNKLEKALDLDLNELGKTNGVYVFTRSQKIARFKNVLKSICMDINKDISLMHSLTNETLYMRDNEYLDQQIDNVIQRLENVRKEIKETSIESKEEKAYGLIDDMFNNKKVEILPPRKKEEKKDE